MAWLTNSGPLSERMNSGALCRLTKRDNTSITRLDRMAPATEFGVPLFLLDAQVVTGRPTAAVSLLAIRKLLAATPKRILMIATGSQAVFHAQALLELYPDSELLRSPPFRA